MKTAYSLLIYALLVCSSFAAGWDTNAWSGTYHRYYLDASTNKVFIKEALSSDAFAACNERADLVGYPRPNTNAWYRSNRADLVNIKSWLSTNVFDSGSLGSYYMYTNWIAGDAVNFSTNNAGWSWRDCATGTLDTNTISQIDFSSSLDKRITKEYVFSVLGIPTNYFTSTPWRKLTDPTTSNGWHFIDDILNMIIYPHSGVKAITSWNRRGESNSAGEHDFNDSSWAAVKTEVETTWATNAFGGAPQRWSEGAIRDRVSGCRWDADAFTAYSYPAITLPSTNVSADCTYYVYVMPQPYYRGVASGASEWMQPEGIDFFGAQGSSFSSHSYNETHTDNNVTGVFTSSVAIGSTVLSIPTWCDEPDGTDSTPNAFVDEGRQPTKEKLGLGYIVMDLMLLADYGNTNGFTYYAD